ITASASTWVRSVAGDTLYDKHRVIQSGRGLARRRDDGADVISGIGLAASIPQLARRMNPTYRSGEAGAPLRAGSKMRPAYRQRQGGVPPPGMLKNQGRFSASATRTYKQRAARQRRRAGARCREEVPHPDAANHRRLFSSNPQVEAATKRQSRTNLSTRPP